MSKIRVSALAKELKITSDALVQILRSIDIPAKSHSSTIDEDVRETVRKKLDEERAAIKEKYAKKGERVRRRPVATAQTKTPDPAKKDESATTGPAAQAESRRDRRPRRDARVRSTARTTEQPAEKPKTTGDSPKPLYRAKPREGAPAQNQHGGRPPYQPRGRGDQQTGNTPRFAPSSNDNGSVRRSSSQLDSAPKDGSFAKPDVSSASLPLKEDHRKKQNKKKKGDDKKKGFEEKTTEVELKANIKKTLARIGSATPKKKYKKSKGNEVELEVTDEKILPVTEFISASELSAMIGVSVTEVIAKCLELGLMVTINHRLDFETISLLAEEWGYQAQLMDVLEDEEEDEEEIEYPEHPRAPVVTIMGHVDHGKTSLLDYIRKTNVMSTESGGITQHIASYEVETKKGKVTFMDTPGHEAFTAMRARGSQITDVAVIIVAADSAVMPQTKEAIDHAKAAGVPIVIALNKIDLPTANPDKIKGELANYDVLVTDYGGLVSCMEISAKKGTGVQDLLELLALETEMLELKAPIEGKAQGVVIESELDKGRGAVATILIQKGTLKKGDAFVTGVHSGKVRELFNDRGEKINSAGPSQPVMVLGLSGTPQAGDTFKVVENEKSAREIASKRRLAEKEKEIRMMSTVTLDNFYETIKEGEIQTLNVIVKGDVDGSIQAVAAALEDLSTSEVKVKVILKGVGGVTETDIMLAKASQAIVIGFHISPNPKIREHAREAGVEIRTYKIIYEAIDDIKSAMIGMLAPIIKEEIIGQVEVREVYKVSKIGQIAGCYVLTGKVERNSLVRLIRDDIVIKETTVDTLQRFKDRVKDVNAGFECGIILSDVSNYNVGDRIEVYKEVAIARKEL